MNIFVVTEQGEDRHWFPWLEEKLQDEGHQVFAPEFTQVGGESLDAWLKAFEEYEDELVEENVFVAHGVNPKIFLSLLEQRADPAACFFMPGEDPGSMDLQGLDFDSVRRGTRYFRLYHHPESMVPVERIEELARELEADIEVLKDIEENEYGEFAQLLEDVQKFTNYARDN